MLKNKILEQSNSVVQNRKDFTTIGKVTKIEESSNICTIEYLNANGILVEKNGVQVDCNIPNLISWFPKVNENVVVKISEDRISIQRTYSGNYSKDIRPKTKTEKEKLCDRFGSTLTGMIF